MFDDQVEKHADLVILGSGSTAFAAATRASELGKSAIMIESRVLGGTCVNRGCLPSKNLLAAAKLVFDAAHPRFPGLTPARMQVDFAALVGQKDEIIQDYRGQHYSSILESKSGKFPVEVIYGRGFLTAPHTVEITIPAGPTHRVRGDHLLIATGSSPVVPEIPGLADTSYLTSDLLTTGEGLELTELPRSLVILGGGAIALELGQLFARLGTVVTIVDRSNRVLKESEPEVSRALTECLRAEGLRIVTHAHIERVTAERGGVKVTALVRQQREEITGERLLVAMGRQPNTVGIGLEQVGVRLDPHGAAIVSASLQTSVPHIWAAGDVIGTPMATPVGAHDGVLAAQNALTGTSREMDHRVIPRTVFTDPQVASIGLTDAEAKRRGIVCQCSVIPMNLVPRSGATRDASGIIKMVLERPTGRVVGVSIVGPHAGEIIHEAAMAMRFDATVNDFVDMVHVYPTEAEALRLVALSFTKDVSKLSCCAS